LVAFGPSLQIHWQEKEAGWRRQLALCRLQPRLLRRLQQRALCRQLLLALLQTGQRR
jgi:hypothetical protein